MRQGIRYATRPGVYAVALCGDGVLLTLQNGVRPELQLPGGGVDRGETPLRALHREVFEETGWRIAVLRRLGAYRRFKFMPAYGIWAEKVCSLYLARAVRPVAAPHDAEHTPLVAPLEQAATLVASPAERQALVALTARRRRQR